MNEDWIKHNGGPQQVAEDIWVEVECVPLEGIVRRGGVQEAGLIEWSNVTRWRIINEHLIGFGLTDTDLTDLIDATLKRGIELGLDAAHMTVGEMLNENTPSDHANLIMRAELRIVELDPETIAKEANND